MKAIVTVRLRPGVLDPEGRAIADALRHLGFDEVRGVGVGRRIELELDGTDRARAAARCDEMGRRLLANGVIEDFTVEMV